MTAVGGTTASPARLTTAEHHDTGAIWPGRPEQERAGGHDVRRVPVVALARHAVVSLLGGVAPGLRDVVEAGPQGGAPGRIAATRRARRSSSSVRAADAGGGVGCAHMDTDSNASAATTSRAWHTRVGFIGAMRHPGQPGDHGPMETFGRDGLVFRVRDRGPDDGVPVVLLHGFPQDSSAFDDVARRLVARGARCLAPDQRGYSPGARPSGRRAYAARELADDVAALLDAAGAAAAHVVGHDWGAGAAWAFAGLHPERTLSLTALSVPHPRAVSAAARRGVQAVRSSYMAAFQLPRLPERLLLADDGARLRRALTGSGLPAPRADAYTRRMLEPGALSGALAWYRGIPTGGWGTLPPATAPTILAHGLEDPFVTAAAIAAARRWVRGPLVTVPVEGGHWLPERHPGTVAHLVGAHLG